MTALALSAPGLFQQAKRDFSKPYRSVGVNVNNRLHAQQHGAAMTTKSCNKTHRTIGERRDIADAVQRAFKTAKIAAKAAGCHPNTVRGWEHSTPSLAHFLEMARNDPAFRAEAARLIGMESTLEPEFQEAFAAFVRAWGQLRGR